MFLLKDVLYAMIHVKLVKVPRQIVCHVKQVNIYLIMAVLVAVRVDMSKICSVALVKSKP